MKRLPLFLLALLFTFSLPLPTVAHIYDLNRNEVVTLEEMLADLASVKLVFIGELHDSDPHHRAQLQVIHRLHELGIKVAIGLEMFQAKDQFALDLWSAGELAEDQFLPIYRANWSMWPVYSAIFRYARDKAIPMLGLNLDREITGMIASNGFASLPPDIAEGLPPIRCDIGEDYMVYLKRVMGGHGGSGKQFLHFCEAQVAWDTFMAWRLVKQSEKNPDQVIVTLAGSGHSWRYGIPEQVMRISPLPYRILLPEMPGRIEQGRVGSADGDYLLLGTESGPLH